MAVPKGKTSKARKHSRRSSVWKLGVPVIAKCPRCQKMKLAHRVCKKCGYYDGASIIKMQDDKKKKKQA